MPVVNRSALLPYSAERMYVLVADIDRYPEFLPWCRSAGFIDNADPESVRAYIEIAKGAVSKRFTTRNRMQHGKMIEMNLLDGPFKHLRGYWRFEALQDVACKVHLDMDFEFSNRLVAVAFGPIFNQAVNTLVDAFVERAAQVYGSE
ncbi:MAG: type II toxin-antitoxin system RatA family toxin [Gammaproteobacteria bacterium]|nr:type II toxin-antitoxin system RatA family toxin [Gammaproteobacteria bacterium]MCP5137037.1 type II toxin-antitoxin system RatA family toxin [Gammaproteobacteria bacterium]